MNCPPRSDMIVSGIPEIRMIWSINSRAICLALVSFWYGIEIGLLLSRSTTTNIASYPWRSFGNERKSIERCCQGRSGIGRGCNNLGIQSLQAFVRLQIKQLSIYRFTSVTYPCQWYLIITSFFIFSTPGCAIKGCRCISSSRRARKSPSSGTSSRPL